MTYKVNLYEIRNNKNITLRQLSVLTGVSRSHLQRIEVGDTIPTICVAFSIARALDVDIRELFEC